MLTQRKFVWHSFILIIWVLSSLWPRPAPHCPAIVLREFSELWVKTTRMHTTEVRSLPYSFIFLARVLTVQSSQRRRVIAGFINAKTYSANFYHNIHFVLPSILFHTFKIKVIQIMHADIYTEYLQKKLFLLAVFIELCVRRAPWSPRRPGIKKTWEAKRDHWRWDTHIHTHSASIVFGYSKIQFIRAPVVFSLKQ